MSVEDGAIKLAMGDPMTGNLMELEVIIAILLGGTRFYGGEGSVLKTVVGALIIMVCCFVWVVRCFDWVGNQAV